MTPHTHPFYERDVEQLKALRTRERAKAKIVDVAGYSRRSARLSGRDSRLARWVDAESAVLRLCKNRDRVGAVRGDYARAQALIALIEDTFL